MFFIYGKKLKDILRCNLVEFLKYRDSEREIGLGSFSGISISLRLTREPGDVVHDPINQVVYESVDHARESDNA